MRIEKYSAFTAVLIIPAGFVWLVVIETHFLSYMVVEADTHAYVFTSLKRYSVDKDFVGMKELSWHRKLSRLPVMPLTPVLMTGLDTAEAYLKAHTGCFRFIVKNSDEPSTLIPAVLPERV